MGTQNVFDRTAIFTKSKRDADGGRPRIKRIPWDLLASNGTQGMLVSPMPVAPSMYDGSSTTVVPLENVDMVATPGISNMIDEVVGIQYFTSEAEFLALFESCIGFWDEDGTQSSQFGYPRPSGI